MRKRLGTLALAIVLVSGGWVVAQALANSPLNGLYLTPITHACGGTQTTAPDGSIVCTGGLPNATRRQVTATDFDEWPFLPRIGTLACHLDDGRRLVRIDFGGEIEYALNGQSRDFGFPELDTTVMPDWPDGSSLGPIIERGLDLC